MIERKLGSIGAMEDAEEAERLLGVTAALPGALGDDSAEGAALDASSAADAQGGVD